MVKADEERGSVLSEMKEEEGKKRKPLHIVLVSVGAVALIALVAVLAFRFGANRPEPVFVSQELGGRGVVAVPENVEELREEANQPVEDGYYETRMNVDWVFPGSGEPSTNAYIENSTNNKRTVYFDLTLADTKELIYSSPFIPVGAKLEKFALNAQVPAGEYQGIVTYHLVDDDYQELTTVSVAVTLRIQG
jgi:flagellar basal body-associated protein FliL